ncbi:hypothetical protein J6590_055290 [Homalodisca vitripennis]|nr:hypothetical protein J6590_055290 [Homalodisca vitripennis]
MVIKKPVPYTLPADLSRTLAKEIPDWRLFRCQITDDLACGLRSGKYRSEMPLVISGLR